MQSSGRKGANVFGDLVNFVGVSVRKGKQLPGVTKKGRGRKKARVHEFAIGANVFATLLYFSVASLY